MAYARPVLCRLCGLPAPDRGVRVSEVDREKLSEWCLRMMDTELDEEGLDEAVFCQFCIWQARFLDETCDPLEKSRLPIWWNQPNNLAGEDYGYKYYLLAEIKPCNIIMAMLSKELLQRHGLLADTGKQKTRITSHKISNCIYCSAQLESRVALVRHVEEEHQNELIFKCTKCKLFFLSSQEKENHMEKLHYSFKFKCFCCDKCFNDKNCLAQHLKSVHERKLISCRYHCSAYFKNKRLRDEHIQEVHETEEKVKCIYCEKSYSKATLLEHVKYHHKSIFIKCTKNCRTFFHTEEERQKHILEVHENPFDRKQCFYCQKRFLKTVMAGHLRAKHERVKVRCHYQNCSTYFHTEEEKQKHILEVHESGKNKYKCIYCQKLILISRSSVLIVGHMKRHHKKEAIKCDYLFRCPNYFLTQEEKQKHILEVHESGEDKIRCKFCPKMVSMKGMKSHIRVYHQYDTKGVKVDKVECIYCKRKMRKISLSSHMRRMHNKMEIIRCNFNKNCSTFFLTVEDRQKHIEQVHAARKVAQRFECCACKNVFNCRKYLKEHILKKHVRPSKTIKC